MKMNRARLLILMPVLVLFPVLLGIWISTQWIASTLHHHPVLGRPLIALSGYRVYPPNFLIWWHQYGRRAPREFDTASLPTFIGTAGGSLLALIVIARRRQEPATSHGTARWADINDLKATGLFDNKGVVLGLSNDGRYLRHDGPANVMVIAPTRTGKGVGVIIPTLLTWPHSVVITDIKGENWGITAGFRRASGHSTLKFDPTDPTGASACFNPLAEIRLRTKNEVRDCQNICDILVDPQGTGQLDHWAKTGHALLVGAVLHVLYTEQDIRRHTLPVVAELLSDPSRPFEATLEKMMRTVHEQREELFVDIYNVRTRTHPVVAQSARELLNKSDNERSGVLSTAMSFLGLYRDPIIAANTKQSDFAISDLMNAGKPVSLYLVIPPSDLSRTRPLVRTILNQITRRLTETMTFAQGKPVRHYRHRLLLLLDEFPSLGRLDAFEAAFAFLAGYGIPSLLAVQSLNQLYKTYTPYNSIMDNCRVRVVYTPNDERTAEVISRLLSQKTELVENVSYSGNRMSAWLGKMSLSTTHVGRPLLTAGEVLVLPHDEEIVFVAGHPPVRARKLFYYADRNLASRIIAAPERSDVLRAYHLLPEVPRRADPPQEMTGHEPGCGTEEILTVYAGTVVPAPDIQRSAVGTAYDDELPPMEVI